MDGCMHMLSIYSYKWCSCLHLSQEVIFAHHVPVPDLHCDGPVFTKLLWVQVHLQGLVPVRKTGFLNNLEAQVYKNSHEIIDR